MRDSLGFTQEEFGQRWGNVPAYRVRDIERDHIKLKAKDAREMAYSFGASIEWLWENKGEMLVKDHHRRKMMASIVAEGLFSAEEVDMLLYLRSIGITSKEKLRRALTAEDIVRTMETAVRERQVKYTTKRKRGTT